MDGPIVFVSHFRVKPGALADLSQLAAQVASSMRDEKPRTLSWLAYLDEAGGKVSFVHVFGDASAMDAHFEGADLRSAAASAFIEPRGWEIYGRPSDAALKKMRRTAAAAGVLLRLESQLVPGGFLRLSPAG